MNLFTMTLCAIKVPSRKELAINLFKPNLLKPARVLLPIGLLIMSLPCGAAFGSEENIRDPYKVSLWADAGALFGKVNVTIERTDLGPTYPYCHRRL